jgi:O-antigen ligase
MKHSDLFAVLVAMYYAVVAALSVLVRRKPWATIQIVPVTALLLFLGATQLAFSENPAEDRLAMLFTLLGAAAGPLQAAGLFAMYKQSEIEAFLNRLFIFLVAVSFIYTAESVFSLGLRSEAGRNLSVDFGIQRVRGPLFGPSTGYLILLPAIGWGLYGFFGKSAKRFWTVMGTAVLLCALLGLGSRAGLILLFVYLLALALLMRDLKRKVLTALMLVGLTAVAATVIYGQADTQRLQSFEDGHRRATHETAWTILAHQPLETWLFGQGYGNVWSWYRRDVLRGERIATGDNLIATPYGLSLYHSHSTILVAVVEFGLVGLAWLLFLFHRVVRLPWVGHGDTGWRSFTYALAMSLFGLGFDLFLFKDPRVNSVWWLFVIAAMRIGGLPTVVRKMRCRP